MRENIAQKNIDHVILAGRVVVMVLVMVMVMVLMNTQKLAITMFILVIVQETKQKV